MQLSKIGNRGRAAQKQSREVTARPAKEKILTPGGLVKGLTQSVAKSWRCLFGQLLYFNFFIEKIS